MTSYSEWLQEMKRNQRGFGPFNPEANLEALIANRPAQKRFFRKLDMGEFDNVLSATSKGKIYHSAEQKLISVFNSATQELLNANFGYHE
jgi:hypothetical protein